MKKEYIEPSVKAVEIKLNQILAGSIPGSNGYKMGTSDNVSTETGSGDDALSFDAEFEDNF